MFKKLALILVCMVGLFVFAGVSAVEVSAAAEWYDVPGVVGGQIEFDKNTGIITDADWDITIANIPTTIDDVEVKLIGGSAFSGCVLLTTITIPDSVTTIGYFAFWGCSRLSTVTIGSSVTLIASGSGSSAFSSCTRLNSINISDLNPLYSSLDGVLYNKEQTEIISFPIGKSGHFNIPNSVNKIGDYAFQNSTSLTSVTIPDSAITIGDYSFKNCTSLTSAIIPNNVTSIGVGAFQECTNLSTVTIGSSVASIEWLAFNECTSLSTVTIPEGVVTVESNAFSDCSSLSTVTIPNSVTSIEDNVFENCTNLSTVIIGDGVTSIGHSAFENCSSLTSITIPDGVTSIGYSAFENCSSLNTVTIPDSITMIRSLAFRSCGSLNTITIPDSVTSIGNAAFSDCDSLVNINVSTFNPMYGSLEGVLYNKIKTEIIQYPAGRSGNVTILNNVTTIGSSAFNGCDSVTMATIPDSVTSIGNAAFANCDSLSTVNIPNSVTSIEGHAFYGCSTLHSVYYSGAFNEWNLIDIGSSNTDLTSANIIYNSLGSIDTGGSNRSFIEVGDSLDISLFNLPETLQGSTVVLESSNPSVASIEGLVVTGVNVGEVVLSLKPKGSDLSYTYKIEVIPPDLGMTTDTLNFGSADGADILKGPEISLLGNNFNLFEYEIKADGRGLGSMFALDAKYDSEAQVTKISLTTKDVKLKKGDNDTYDEIVELVSSFKKSPSNFSRSFNNIMADRGSAYWDLGFKANVTGVGHIEIDHKTGYAIPTKCGLVVELTLGVDVNYYFPPAPVIYITFGIEGKASAGFELVYKEAFYQNGTPYDINGVIGLSITPKIGAGLDVVVGRAEVGVEGTIAAEYKLLQETLKKSLRAYISSTVYFEWKAFLFFSDRYNFAWDAVELYPNFGASASSSIEPGTSYDISPGELTFTPMPRTSEYASALVDYSIESAPRNLSKSQEVIHSNVFQNAVPSVITVGDTTMAVFEMDEASRPSGDRTMLYYALKTPSGWSAIKPVEDDGTADFAPTLFELNNEIYVVWSNAVTTLGESSTLEQTLESMTLRVARYDGNGFVDAKNVMEANGLYPMDVNVATSGNTATIAWVENSLNSIFEFKGDYSLNISSFNGTTFTAPQQLANTTNPIMGVDSSYSEGVYSLGYVENSFSGLEIQNSAIKLYSNADTVTVAQSAIPKQNINLTAGNIFWMENGILNAVDLTAQSSTTTQLADAVAAEKVVIIEDGNGRKAMIYTVADGYHNELYVRYHEGTEFGEATQLTEADRNISEFDAIFNAAGELEIAYGSTAIDQTITDSSIYTQTDLMSITITDAIDLQIVGEPYYDVSTVAPGQSVTINVDVKNNSSVPISSVKASVDGGSATTHSLALQPGEVGTVEVSKSLSSSFVSDSFPITVSPASGSDAYTSDNTVTVELFYRDIEIVGYEVEGREATVTVINNSKQTVNNISVELIDERMDGTVLDTQSIATLSAGRSSTVTFTLPGEGLVVEDVYDVEYFYVSASIVEPETVYSNNHMSAPVAPKRPVSLSITNANITLAGGETEQITATVLPDDAFNKDLFYVMADESIAEVDENGVVTGLKKGETTITVITKDSAIMQTVFVDVTSTAVRITGNVSFDDATTQTTIRLYDSTDTEHSNALFTETIPAGEASETLTTEEFSVNTSPGSYDVVVTKDNCLPYIIKGVEVPVDGMVDLSAGGEIMHLVTGDVDNNGTVNEQDIQAIFDNDDYNKTVIIGLFVDADADVNGDDRIDFNDTAIIRNSRNFAKTEADCVVVYGG